MRWGGEEGESDSETGTAFTPQHAHSTAALQSTRTDTQGMLCLIPWEVHMHLRVPVLLGYPVQRVEHDWHDDFRVVLNQSYHILVIP